MMTVSYVVKKTSQTSTSRLTCQCNMLVAATVFPASSCVFVSTARLLCLDHRFSFYLCAFTVYGARRLSDLLTNCCEHVFVCSFAV